MKVDQYIAHLESLHQRSDSEAEREFIQELLTVLNDFKQELASIQNRRKKFEVSSVHETYIQATIEVCNKTQNVIVDLYSLRAFRLIDSRRGAMSLLPVLELEEFKIT